MAYPHDDTEGNKRADESPGAAEEKSTQMTRQKAGQRGGLTTAKRHGREFYERIGRKGGQSRKKKDRDGVPA